MTANHFIFRRVKALFLLFLLATAWTASAGFVPKPSTPSFGLGLHQLAPGHVAPGTLLGTADPADISDCSFDTEEDDFELSPEPHKKVPIPLFFTLLLDPLPLYCNVQQVPLYVQHHSWKFHLS
jgi:hypothetical protein